VPNQQRQMAPACGTRPAAPVPQSHSQCANHPGSRGRPHDVRAGNPLHHPKLQPRRHSSWLRRCTPSWRGEEV